MKPTPNKVIKIQSVIKIQRWYRRHKDNERKARCLKLGISPLDQCPFDLIDIYQIPEEKILILSINGVKRPSNLVKYLKMMSLSDFLTIPRHYWNTDMSNEDFDAILKKGREYLYYIKQKHTKYIKMDNDNMRTIKDYVSLYSDVIEKINVEIEEVGQLIDSIAQTNYYRTHVNKKFEQLEEQYQEHLIELTNIYEKHPCILEQSKNRTIKLTESYTLSQIYLPGFLEKMEQKIATTEQLRIHIDSLYTRAGWCKTIIHMHHREFAASGISCPEKNAYVPEEAIPSAPPPYSQYLEPLKPLKSAPRLNKSQKPPRPPPPNLYGPPQPRPRGTLYPDLSKFPTPSAPPAQQF